MPEPAALCVLDLAAIERGRHLVGLVAHDEVPAAIRSLWLLLYVFVARQLVQARNYEIYLQRPARGGLQPCLVVCLGSLAEQWQDELYRRVPTALRDRDHDKLEAARTGRSTPS